jgi:PAS domain S-box-containing protein
MRIEGKETKAVRRKTTAIRDALLFWRRREEPGREQAGEASGTDEVRFSALGEVVFEGVAVVEGGRISEANEVFASMFGYELPAVAGRTLAELVAPESRGLVEKSISDGFDGSCEAVGLKRDGTRLKVEIRARASSYGDRAVHLIAVRDVTGGAEETGQPRELYEGVLKAQSELGEGLVIIEDQRIRYANEAFCEISGYDLVELRALSSFMKLIPEDESASILERPRRLPSGGEVETHYDTGLRRKDGRRVDIEIAFRTLEEEGRSRVVVIVRDITGRKRAESRLRETEERYRTLVEQIPAVTYIQDAAQPGSDRPSSTMYASPQIEEQSGYPPQAFVEDPELWVKLLHPTDRKRVLDEDARTEETGEPFRMEYRQLARDGRVVWIRDEAVLVREEEGNPSYWLGIQHDITEQKLAQEALKESELRLRTVISNVPVVLFALDRGGVVTLSEGRGLENLGFEPGEMVGRSISELYGDRPEILEDVNRALGGEEFSAVREVAGMVFETWYSPLQASTGEVIGMIGVATDVTERERAEKALREAEELFRSAFDDAPVGISVSSPDGHYLRANRALCDILGYSEEELRATTFQALTYQEDYEASMAYVDRLLAGEIDRYSMEKRYVRADGRPVWVSLSVSLVRAPDNRPLYYVAQVQDITERKQAEERLREANRRLEELAALRTDFTAMVAHEIGSPLASVRGFLEVLATGELEPDDQADALVKIRAEINRLSTLVADIRSAATIERDDFALMLRRTAVDKLFEDAVRFAETLPGDHPLTVKVEADGRVWADPYRIGQVLRNLLSNAAKYSPDGAPIELRAKSGETSGRIRIEVADRGRGVYPDDVDLIFEKFGRGRDRSGRKAYGVGLGLYLSKRILQAHGGDLTLDPAPKGGSVFSFELEETA